MTKFVIKGDKPINPPVEFHLEQDGDDVLIAVNTPAEAEWYIGRLDAETKSLILFTGIEDPNIATDKQGRIKIVKDAV